MRHLSLCRLLRTLCFALLVAVTPGAWAQVNGPACDTYTNKTTANGLGSNRVQGVYVVGNTVYAAINGGGLSISTDGGYSFTTKTNNGLGSASVNDVYVVGSTVYAATYGGLSISTDGGSSFTNRTDANGLGSNNVQGVYVVGRTVYAATAGDGFGLEGLSISTDGGSNFTRANGLAYSTSVFDVYAVGSTIYAATERGLSISTDGGSSFTTKTTANGLGTNSLNGVYVVGSTVYAATEGGLSISTDGGSSFTTKTTNDGLGSNTVYGVYALGRTVYAATLVGLSISTNGGSSFTNYTPANGLGDDTVFGVYALGTKVYAATRHGLAFCPVDPPLLNGFTASPPRLVTTGSTILSADVTRGKTPYSYVFSGPGVISQATNRNTASVSGLSVGVQTFTVVVSDATSPISQTTTGTVSVTVTAPVPGGPACDYYATKTDANGLGSNNVVGVYVVGSTVYAATLGGLSISTNEGSSFTTKTTANGLGSNSVVGVYVVGSTVYAATLGGLSISTNGGSSFTNRTDANGLGSNRVNGVYVVGSTVYAATDGGVSISTNGGSSFTTKTTANGLGSNNVVGVYVVGSTVYAATLGGLSISTDGGGSFTNKTPFGLLYNATLGVYVVGSTVYVATAGSGLIFSTDGGSSFTQKTTNDGLGSNRVNGVYALGSTVYAATAGGLSISTNGGSSFTNNTANGLGSNFVQGVYALSSKLYAATSGGLSFCPAAVPPLVLSGFTASPPRLVTTGSTSLSADVTGGKTPYSYVFSGPGVISQATNSNTASLTVLGVGVQTFTVVVSDAISQTTTGTVSVTVTAPVTGSGPACDTYTNKTPANGLGENYVFGVYVVGSTVYAATDGGLSISTNGGSTFTNKTTANGLGSNRVNGVYVVGSTVYAATAGGVSISTNGGSSFTNRTDANGLGSNFVQGVYVVGSTIYAATYGGGVSISTNGGSSFTNKTTEDGLGSNRVNGVFALGSTVYAATDGGLSISTDGGSSFTNKTTANGLGDNKVYGVYALGSTVYAATDGGLSISTDGGSSFTNKTTANGLGDNTVYGVYALGSTVYAATNGFALPPAISGGGVSISTNGGSSFTTKTTANGLGSNTVLGVYALSSKLYAATSGGLSFCLAEVSPLVLNGFTASPASVCVGNGVTFTATVANVTGSYGYTLTNGASTTTGSSNNPAFSQPLTASGSGLQTFTLTVSSQDQVATATTSLTVNAPPRPTLVSSGTLTCAQTSVTLTASGGNSYTFTSPGGGVLGTSGVTTTRTVSSPGAYSVRVGNANGCVSSTSTTVLNNTAVITTSNPAISTGNINTAFRQPFTASGGVAPYSFSLASGSLPMGLSLSTAGVLSGTPTQGGSFPLVVRGTDANGCSDLSPSYVLTVNATPSITGFNTLDNTVCVGSSISFTATVGNVTGSYNFTLTNGSSSRVSTASGSGFSQNLTAIGSGSQSFTLTVGDNGFQTTATTTLTVNSLPVPTLSASNAGLLTCTQTSLTLTAGGGNAYAFSGPGVLSRTGNTAIVNAAGVYSVTVTNTLTGCSSTTTTTLTSTTDAPSVSIMASATTLSCTTSSVSLTAVGAGTVVWSTRSTEPVITVSASGIYSVTATTSNGCSATASTTITSTNALITLSSPGQTTATVGEPFSQPFTAAGGTGPYSFSIASGTLPPGLSLSGEGVLSGSPTQAGSFSVVVQAQDAGGCMGVANTAYILLIRNVAPTLTLTNFSVNPASVCVGNGVTFMATIANVTGSYDYTLTNGASTTTGSSNNSAFSQMLIASGSGVRTFTLTVSSAGQSATATNTLTVNPLPVSTLSSSNGGLLTCTQTSLTLTAGGGDTYRFSGPGVLSQTGNTAVVNVSGTYSVTATSTSGCFSTTSLTISQQASVPTATLSASNGGLLTCAQTSLTLTAGGGTTYAFSGPGVVSQSGNMALVNAAGLYSVTVTNTETGCFSTTTTTLTSTTDAPSVSIMASAPALSCAISSVTLTASPGGQTGATLAYRFSAGATQLGSSNQATVSSPGLYSVTVINGGNGCSGVASVSVSQNNSVPTATISGNLTVTSGGSTTLTASGGTSQRWSTGETIPSIVVMAGTYSVTVANASGCSGSTSVTVSTGNLAPVATANASQTATVGVPFAYTVNAFTDREMPNQLTYSASIVPANGFNFDANSRIISGTPSMSGVSSVTVTATDPGSLSASTTFTITVSPANTPPPTDSFSITGVTTLSCETVTAGQRQVTFNPRYAGLDGSPVSFLVVSELAPTTSPGPYTLKLYTDNPVITLQVLQRGVSISYAYNWLSACSSSTGNTPPTVASPVPPQSATVGIAYTLSLAGVFTDAQTPNGLSLSVTGLPSGLSFTAPSTISGTPSVSGVSQVSVVATDPGSLSASLSFTLTVGPGNGNTPPPTGPFAITGVTSLGCTPVVANQFSIRFTPRYSGLDGSPVSFSVTHELLPTTQPGPYTLQLYSDNPVITLEAQQNGAATRYAYNWLEACNSSTSPNTPPRVVMGIPGQTATVGQYVSYVIPGGTFTDEETPGSLHLSASGLPAGLSFSGATLLGTPSSTVGSPVSITITATDPGGLSASTLLSLTVLPASGTPPTTAPFAITAVTTLSCTPVADRINLVFAPRYAGLRGQPIAFEVVNELSPTTNAAPYSLTLYRDNPVLQLRATQSGDASPATFSYNWLAGCTGLGQDNTPPRLNEPVASQTATVGQGYSLNLSNTFIDQETPTQIMLTASGLPSGLSLSGQAITGTPSLSGVSSVTLTATDGSGLSTSTVFSFTVVPASVTPPPTAGFSLTGVTTLSCEVLSAGERRLTFAPRYAGLDGSPVSFSVVNELAATTVPGPYVLNLYTDNPVIILSAVQSGVVSQFSYGWLAACNPGARLGSGSEVALRVTVLGNPVVGETVEVEVRGAEGQPLRLSLTDERGRVVSEQAVPVAVAIEHQTLRLGHQPGGILLLRVSTPTQSQTVRLLRNE